MGLFTWAARRWRGNPLLRIFVTIAAVGVLVLLNNHRNQSGSESQQCGGRARPVAGSNCGLGGSLCGEGFYCDVHPTDAWAVCCPTPGENLDAYHNDNPNPIDLNEINAIKVQQDPFNAEERQPKEEEEEGKEEKEEEHENNGHGELSKHGFPEPDGWRPHRQPVTLDLKLNEEILNHKSLSSEKNMFHSYGFNLNLSNHIPLAHDWPDHRNDACKARAYPPLHEMPKVSVIIIFYNEPLSTLLRNVIGVLNRSPPELLGEIVLVNDHSQMHEHILLEEHLERLNAKLPASKVRLVQRDIHNGIVGARVRGAEEAIYPIILFLDSHAEACDGWLEPLVARIHGDRTRVVVPNIRSIDIHHLTLSEGDTWPPSRGTFNWRLSFDIVAADASLDVIELDVDKMASATKTAVMPGGLFAIDRKLFFELGAYDPEIMYYGAEHVELSFRTWMCGASMEIVPCSNVGHIYREFDRFGVDPQLKGVNVGKFLDRNDARVAEVWLDEYKKLFFQFRPMPGINVGDLSLRKKLRADLKCKSFDWFLKEIVRDLYVPDFNPTPIQIASPSGTGYRMCLDHEGRANGEMATSGCARSPSTRFIFTEKGLIQSARHVEHHLVCMRVERMSQMLCNDPSVARWKFSSNGKLQSQSDPNMCLGRGVHSNDQLKFQACKKNDLHQTWMFGKTDKSGSSTLSGLEWDLCLDNMQKTAGAPGLYGCHGQGTQRWKFTEEGKLKSEQHGSNPGVCIGFGNVVGIFNCQVADPDFVWEQTGDSLLKSKVLGLCLERGRTLILNECNDTNKNQKWEMAL